LSEHSNGVQMVPGAGGGLSRATCPKHAGDRQGTGASPNAHTSPLALRDKGRTTVIFPWSLVQAASQPNYSQHLSRRCLFASHIFPDRLVVLGASVRTCFFLGVSDILISSSGQSYTFKCYAVSFRFPQAFHGFSTVSVFSVFLQFQTSFQTSRYN